MMQVPQGTHALHAHLVEHRRQTGGVSILRGGLNQQGHVVDAGDVAQLLQEVHDIVVVHVTHRMNVAREQQAHIGGAHVACKLDVARDLVDVVLATALVGQLAVGREAGDLEAQALELLAGAFATVGLEGSRVRCEGAALDAADLDAIEAKVLGHGVNVSPRV